MFLYQIHPFLFYDRMDIFSWIFIQINLHQWLLNNESGQIFMDVLFYSMPVIFFLSTYFKKNISFIICIAMLIVNWCYVECYTLYPTNSIEGHVCWLLFPIIFLPRTEKTFIFLFDGLRYFFLFFFFSSGLWKIVQGGLFNISQMSGILLLQHKEMLTNSPDYWQTKFIFYLINHQILSYSIYVSGAVAELSFGIGFFTKKYDKYLAILFVFFLILNFFIMRIPYFEVLPFLITLIYSNKEIVAAI